MNKLEEKHKALNELDTMIFIAEEQLKDIKQEILQIETRYLNSLYVKRKKLQEVLAKYKEDRFKLKSDIFEMINDDEIVELNGFTIARKKVDERKASNYHLKFNDDFNKEEFIKVAKENNYDLFETKESLSNKKIKECLANGTFVISNGKIVDENGEILQGIEVSFGDIKNDVIKD